MNLSLSKRAFIWNGFGKFGQYSISLILNIVLARLLEPNDFGLMGLLTVFMVISNLFIESGFRDALIRKNKVDEIEYSSVFYFNLVASLVIYILLFFFSPLIAEFYSKPILIPISRWLFLTFIVNSLSIVQIIHYEKKLDFKALSKINIFTGLTSGVIGVVLAYIGLGVWALLISYLSSSIIKTTLLWCFSNWRPLLKYNHDAIKKLFGFSSKLLLSGLVAHICANIPQLLIGKYYSIIQVGYYDRALTLQRIPMTTLSDVLNQVSYPLLANNDKNRKEIFYKLIKVISFISVPLFMFLIVLAKPLVLFLLTDKWVAIVPYFQLLCLAAIFYPLSIINSSLLKINNHAGLILKNELLRNGLLLIVIFGLYKLSILELVSGIVCVNLLFPFKTFFDLDRLVYKGVFKFYLNSLSVFFVFSLVSSLLMFELSGLFSNYLFVSILFQGFVGVGSYLILIFVFRRKILDEIIQMIIGTNR
jgi:teichuronic acid exporter